MKTRPEPLEGPTNLVSVGHNADVREVVLIFGPPDQDDSKFVTFTPSQAREIGAALIREAKQAERKKVS